MSDAGPFEALLELQERDTRLDQIRHQHEAMPEREQAREVSAQLVAVAGEIATAQERADELQRDQRRVEDEVASIESHIAATDQKLYGGAVTSPRELQALQDELQALGRRQRTLEDKILDLMEALEPVTSDLGASTERRAGLEAQLADLEAVITVNGAELDVEAAAVTAEREDLAAGIDDELLEEYESLRASLDGVAIARLEAGRCGGCHLTLSAVEQDRIKNEPRGATVRCEECARLLVRAARPAHAD